MASLPRDALGDQRFHGGKPIGPTSCDADATHENARKGRIDQCEIDGLIGDQVHRQSEEQMRADGRESHDHEVPLSHRLVS